MDDIADFYAWTREQADALRRRADNEIDRERVAEELDALGGSEKREISSRLVILLEHLLKWKFQPSEQSNSWRASILEARDRISAVIEDSPSLHSHPGQRLAKAFKIARLRAIDETRLDMPEECPWTIEQVLDEDFLP